MNTDMTWEIESTSSERTEQLAEAIGSRLRGGELIELVSDLGGGKTTFTRGLVRGTGSTDRVASPTFTLSREYSAPHFTIAHFDFYRLAEAGIMTEELVEMMQDPLYVIVVEWADVVQDVLPAQRLTINVQQLGDEKRLLTITAPKQLGYLMEHMK